MKLNYLQYFGYSLLYLVALFFAVWMVFFVKGEISILNSFSFTPWDAEHVQLIATEGYDLVRCAFFPLFPFFWKLTGFSPSGISILNGLIFMIAFTILMKELQVGLKATLMHLGIPVIAFMFLPYSESLLFLFIVLFYIGLKRNSLVMICVALFLMSLTKPTVGILIPGIFIAEFLGEKENSTIVKRWSVLLGIVLFSNALVLLIQFFAVGDFFAFFKAQAEWGNRFSIPNFPLTTWNHQHMIWIDSVSLYFCLVAGFIVCFQLWKRIRYGNLFIKSFSYAALYLAGTGLFILFFRGGQLFSLGRFVLTSPFLIIALYEGFQVLKPKHAKVFSIVFASGFLLFSLAAGSYLHIKLLLSYSVIALLLACWIYASSTNTSKYFWIFSVLVMFAIQVWCTVAVIHGEWIG